MSVAKLLHGKIVLGVLVAGVFAAANVSEAAVLSPGQGSAFEISMTDLPGTAITADATRWREPRETVMPMAPTTAPALFSTGWVSTLPEVNETLNLEAFTLRATPEAMTGRMVTVADRRRW